MTKKESELKKIIKDADQAIATAETAKAKRREAQEELRKHQQKAHLDRLYDIGRIAYETGADRLDDMVLAGIFARAIEVINSDQSANKKLREKGTSAIELFREAVDLEVLIHDRPNRSISSILREAGLKKEADVTRDGQRWTRYVGQAAKAYLERRLEGTGVMIKVITSCPQDFISPKT